VTSTRKQPAPDPRAALLARLRAGLTPDDPAYVHTYAERTPARDYLRVWPTATCRGAWATHSSMATHARFDVSYGRHTPTCWWSYAAPAGVDVVGEPDGDEVA
jgi:hypothetical protein